MAKKIKASVGKKGKNKPEDVIIVQDLLVKAGHKLGKTGPKKNGVDGDCGPVTEKAIAAFQKKIGFTRPDSRVDPDGQTLAALNNGGKPPKTEEPAKGEESAGEAPKSKYFTHAGAEKVKLKYGAKARKMKSPAEMLLKSILASVGIPSAELTSTLRTYHDQARICLTQVAYSNIERWYGSDVLAAYNRFKPSGDIKGFAAWWESYDKKRGRVSSRHLSNQALDVVPSKDRAKFAKKVEELVPVSGSGVRRIIPKGVMGEPVDHVEFTFKVC